MDPALNGIIAPWAQLGIVGSVVLALGVTVYLQWRHIVDLYAAHLADVKVPMLYMTGSRDRLRETV